MVTTLIFFSALACGRLPAPTGIAAMQSINITAPTPAFMTALFGAAALWRRYLSEWTAWNHVRTLAALAAAAAFTAALT